MKLDEFIMALMTLQGIDGGRRNNWPVVVYDYDTDTDKHVSQIEADRERRCINIFTKKDQ